MVVNQSNMALSYASNAVLSKARSMYGNCFTDKNYEELISCRNIPDVASYLKKKTNYTDVLKDINENNVHRRDIEERLRLKLFLDFEILGRYDISVGEHFSEYFISRTEIEQFMHSLMLISAGKPGERIFPIPDFFYDHTKVDLRALPLSENYDAILSAVKNSPYYNILCKFKPKKGELLDITGIETALHNYLYKVVFNVIDKYIAGEPKKELKSFFNLYIDLSNLVRIVRMKKFYKLSADYMKNSLIEGGTLKKEKLNSFIETADNKQMMADMKQTPMGRKWFSRNLDVIDKVPRNMRFNWCRHNIRFSVSPPIVLISYIFLKETEILNIITIIEGIKYKLPPEEIKKMLIR